MPSRAGVAFVDILPRFTKFAAGLEAGLGRVGTRMDTLGRRLSKTLALPLAAIGVASVKLAVDFEQTMSRIEGLVGLSADQVQRLSKEVLALAPAVGKGPRELAEALYFIVSSGIDASDAMEVLKTSARAAAAGLGETRTVADAVTSAMNSYGATNLSAAQATDILAATVREGKGEASELASVIGRVIPVAAQVGVEFDQVGAAIASMTLTGLDAAEAVTALRQFFTLLLKPAAQSRKALSELGLTAGDVAQITQRLDLSLTKGGLSVDRLRKIVAEKGLFEGMIALKTALGGNLDALGAVIPNVRALTGFLSIAGKNADQNAGIFRELANATGATDKAFAAASKTARFKMQAALASLQSAGIQLGSLLLPVVKQIVDRIIVLVKRFSELPEPIKKVVVQAAAFAAVLGPLLFVGAKFVRTLQLLSGGLLFLARRLRIVKTEQIATAAATRGAAAATATQAASTTAAATSAGRFGTLLSTSVIGPLGLLATGLVAAGGFFLLLRRRVDTTSEGLALYRDATLRLKDAVREEIAAGKDVVEQQKRVNKLRKDGKTHTDEYRKAIDNLAAARARHEEATRKDFAAQRDQLEGIQKTVEQVFKPGFIDRFASQRAPDTLRQLAAAMDELRRAGAPLETILRQIEGLRLRKDQESQLKALASGFYEYAGAAGTAREAASKAFGVKIDFAKNEKPFKGQIALVDGLVEAYNRIGPGAAASSNKVRDALKDLIRVTAEHALGVAREQTALGKYTDTNSELLGELGALKKRYPELASQIQVYINKVITAISSQRRQVDVAKQLEGVLLRIKGLPASMVKIIQSKLVGLIDGSFTNFKKVEDRLKAIKNLSPVIRKEIIARLKAEIQVALRIQAEAFESKTRHLQHGGTFAAGETAFVGERGPELVRFSRPGRVYSNSDLRSLLANIPQGANVDSHDTINVNVINPKPERLELSLPAAMRRAELARARG